jgi:tetratricopeptide (TPR) repeat protein
MSDDLKKQETILTNNQEKDQDASNESLKKDTIWSKIPLIFSVISIVLYSVGWLYTRAYFRAFSIDESSLGFSALYYITSGIWGIIASFMTIFALILLGFFTHDEPNEDTKKEAELKYPKLTRFFNRINIPFEKYSQFSDKYIPLNGIIACFLVGIALPYILIQATNVIEDGSKMFYLCCTAYFPLLVWCAVKIKTTINKEKYIENLRSKLNGWFALYFFVFYVAFSASVIGTAEGMFAYGGDSLPKIELKIKVSSSTKNDNKILGNLIIHRNGNYYILVRKDKDTDSIYAFPSLLIVPDSNVESAKTDMGKYVFGLKRVSDFGVKHFMPREESNMFFLRATVYDKEGAYDKAIADYSKAIELDPKFGVAYYRRGVNYHNKDEWAKAIQDFNKAQELFPFDTEVYYKRGLSYEKKGNFDEAKFNYTVVIELDPKNAQAYYSTIKANMKKQLMTIQKQ